MDRFWSKVDAEGDCWLWTAGTDGDGYGRFWFGDRHYRAHRFAFELLVGPIPDGMQLDHMCETPSCVNPDHLRVMSPEAHTAHTARHERRREWLERLQWEWQ